MSHLFQLSHHIATATLIITLLVPTLASAEGQIVKLDARLNTQKNPIQLYLHAGTYQVTPVGKAQGGDKTAWSAWEHTTCKQPQGCARTVPTKFTGLHNNYYVISEHLGTVSIDNKTLPEVDETPKHRMNSYYLVNDETRAYEVAQPLVYPDETGALAGAQNSVFTLTENTKVKFALLDNSRTTDNRGGMSLKITPVEDTEDGQ